MCVTSNRLLCDATGCYGRGFEDEDEVVEITPRSARSAPASPAAIRQQHVDRLCDAAARGQLVMLMLLVSIVIVTN